MRLHQAAASVFYSENFTLQKGNSEYEWGGVRALLYAPEDKVLVAGGMGPADKGSAGTDGPMRIEAFDTATGKSVAAFLPAGSKGMVAGSAYKQKLRPAGKWSLPLLSSKVSPTC